MEALADPFRIQVYIAIYERPGVTIPQVAGRLGHPARRVRLQVERLIAVGLIVVETETRKRNMQARHH
jgi:predicted transcriptional regulator